MAAYDIIGDVHGCADKLVGLLRKLGYVNEREEVASDGTTKKIPTPFRHPKRQAIFVGDLIDRGDYQLDSVAIVRAMVEDGSAKMVIGNHEFNAVAYATKNDAGEWCRPHNDKNNGQHARFLQSAPHGSAIQRELLDWFMTLPLWLDLGGVRVVHACWDARWIDHLRPLVSSTGGLTRQIVIDGTTKGTRTYDAIETLLKGPEATMDGCYYMDKDGHRRDHGRLEWWNSTATTLREAVRIDPSWTLYDESDSEIEQLPATPLESSGISPYTDSVPVVFGHYWFEGPPVPQDVRTACVDYSAVKGGPLVGYQWDGETILDAAKFAYFQAP
jgi:hypothetical protein